MGRERHARGSSQLPALIHPGRNRKQLKEKRDRLLASLQKKGVLEETEYELACMEPLPEAPLPLPNDAPHLLERLAAEQPGQRIQTSVRQALQRQTQALVNRYAREYSSNHIYNLAAIVADVETGEVLAYAGNATYPADERRGTKWTSSPRPAAREVFSSPSCMPVCCTTGCCSPPCWYRTCP